MKGPSKLATQEVITFSLGGEDSHQCYDPKSRSYTFPITGRYIVTSFGEMYIVEVNAGESMDQLEYVEKLMNKP